MRPAAPDELTPLGHLGRPYQLAGGLHFYPLGPAEAEAVQSLSEVMIEGLGTSRVRELRRHGDGFILYLTRALSREAARELTGRTVLAPASLLPEAVEPYLDKLLGLPVYLEGTRWGEVTGLLNAGLQDLLLVRGGEGETMVPLQAPYVRLSAEAVWLEGAPAGLLEP